MNENEVMMSKDGVATEVNLNSVEQMKALGWKVLSDKAAEKAEAEKAKAQAEADKAAADAKAAEAEADAKAKAILEEGLTGKPQKKK
jgi:membrane protein involved in colicin uptake